MMIQFISEELKGAKINLEKVDFQNPPLFNDYVDVLSFCGDHSARVDQLLTEAGKITLGRVAGRTWILEGADPVLCIVLSFESLQDARKRLV